MIHSHRRGRWGLLAALALVLTLVAASAAIAAAPVTSSPPELAGTFRQGSTITTTNGLWRNNPTSFTYQWQRCDSNGSNCRNISGETRNSYRLAQADVGRAVLALVTVRNADGSSTANSKPSPAIADNVAPQNSAAPTISGIPAIGQTLTATPGSWTGAPTFNFKWLQCDAAGAACSDTGSRGRTYGVHSDDLGRTIRVEVTATNPKGRATATSGQTGVVRASAGGGGGSGTAVPVSSVSLPDRLVITSVSFTPTAIRNRIDPITLRVRISDTRGRLVQGALVLASVVPFGRVTESPEVATDATGIATIVVRPTARMPLVRGGSVVFFLRARKAGDDVLAGVSSRRLVQVRIIPG